MSVPEKVVAFLKKNRPRFYCDDCIKAALDLPKRQEVQMVTSTLALCVGYQRTDAAICSECQSPRNKFVIGVK